MFNVPLEYWSRKNDSRWTLDESMHLTLDLDETVFEADVLPVVAELRTWCRAALAARSDVVTFHA